METTDALLRPIDDLAGYRACVALQRATWGEDFAELVPPTILMVVRKIGGLLAGAFGSDDELLGFVFGMPGLWEERPVHWSHMLAVHPGARGRGLGRRLKLHQRERLLERGTDVVLWTFDPLVSRNAHLNLNRLGVTIQSYEPDLYGAETNSPLHAVGGTDRFVVRWRLTSDRARRAMEGDRPAGVDEYADAPVVSLRDTGGDGTGEAGSSSDAAAAPPFPLAERALVEIPRDVQELRTSDREEADRWRRLTRAALPWYLERGYRVEGLLPDPDGRRYRYALRGT